MPCLPRWALILAAVLLGGCGSTPRTKLSTAQPAPMATPKPGLADPQLQAFERSQADRATRAEALGQWADAALAWEVLSLLHPADNRLRERQSAAGQRGEALAGEREAAAGAAQRRGDLEAAAQAYLEALSLDPSRRGAAEALRQIERERNRRAFVGRFSRLTIAKLNPGDSDMAAPEGSEPARSANSLREHATMLVRQGDLDGAIQMLRESPLSRSDAAQRALLIELHLQKAEGLKQRQPDAARAAVEAALALDRRHPAALALQQQLATSKPRVAP